MGLSREDRLRHFPVFAVNPPGLPSLYVFVLDDGAGLHVRKAERGSHFLVSIHGFNFFLENLAGELGDAPVWMDCAALNTDNSDFVSLIRIERFSRILPSEVGNNHVAVLRPGLRKNLDANVLAVHIAS